MLIPLFLHRRGDPCRDHSDHAFFFEYTNDEQHFSDLTKDIISQLFGVFLIFTDELIRIKKYFYRCFKMYTMLGKVDLILSLIPFKGRLV